ncbi:MAG: radical SAM protein [Lentisphaerae bacterium GWF2_45_14]|nr:MAG: radical SAM protein [Lentisphaerae bacterium GWF2_45_14]
MGNDKFRIDSHKLIYHPERVADWLNGKNIYPIYMEISPCGACNIRCKFCSVDFMGYKNRKLETDILLERISELGQLGLKSIMYAGEGEPFLHPDMCEITEHTKENGIDSAFTTNGILMEPKKIERILPVTEWIKVSCNAGTRDVYAQVHGTQPENFDKVFKNLTHAVKVRRENNYKCTLGIQSVLLPDNADTMVDLAKRASDIGLDYFVVKPYMPHHLNRHSYDIKYGEYESLEQELKKFQNEKFNIIFRLNAMSKWDHKEREYKKCLALPFWSYIDAGGNVWGCIAHLDNDKFIYGNIYESTFKEIWEGEKRAEFLKWIAESFCLETCKINCRMDEVNKYLWQLKNPPGHVNFI